MDEQSVVQGGGLSRRFPVRLLGRPEMSLGTGLLAFVLTLPSAGSGWLADDDLHRAMLRGSALLSEQPVPFWDLFNFLDGDPARTRRLMDAGIVPWWTHPQARTAFWRPLTSLTHWLDHRLWPDDPRWMHLHSLLWLAFGVTLLAVFYRRLLAPAWVAGLAALLYAVDDARVIPAGFLANRNALVAFAFGTAALIFHDRWRRDCWRPGAVLAPCALALSLLSGELGVSTLAYMLAYAIFLDRRSVLDRAAGLLPAVLVVVLWRVCWSIQGYGVGQMGVYVDPLSEPRRFILAALDRIPPLLIGQWALPPADFYGLIDVSYRPLYWLAAVILLAVLAWATWPALRTDRVAGFFLAGMLTSAILGCATFPSDRVLGFVGVGAMGLLARFLAMGLNADAMPARPASGPLTPWRRRVAVALACIHLAASPVLLAGRSFHPLGPWFEQFYVEIPPDPAVAGQDVVILNAPIAILGAYLPIRAELHGWPVPRHTWVLGPSQADLHVHREDERTLLIEAPTGFMRWVLDELFRHPNAPFAVGDVVRLSGLDIQIVDLTSDGRPSVVRYTFDRPLECPTLRFLHWNGTGFAPFTPPPVGQSTRVSCQFMRLIL